MTEIFQSVDGWRFRVKGENGEIVATSEAYTREHDAKRGATALLKIMLGEVRAHLDAGRVVTIPQVGFLRTGTRLRTLIAPGPNRGTKVRERVAVLKDPVIFPSAE